MRCQWRSCVSGRAGRVGGLVTQSLPMTKDEKTTRVTVQPLRQRTELVVGSADLKPFGLYIHQFCTSGGHAELVRSPT